MKQNLCGKKWSWANFVTHKNRDQGTLYYSLSYKQNAQDALSVRIYP